MRTDHRNKASEVAHSRKIAPHAESVWGWSSSAGRLRAERRTALLTQLSGIRAGQRALEIGCGTGMFTEKLAHSGVALTAVDISPELVRLAKDRLREVSNVTLLLADVESLPFSDQFFDAVIGSSILHHLPLPASILEIRRVLRPGGKIAFAEPNMMNPQIMIQKNIPIVKKWLGDSPDETAFFRWRLAKMFGQAGFIDVVIEPYDFLHPAVPHTAVPWIQRIGALVERIPLLREIAGSLIIGARRPWRSLTERR